MRPLVFACLALLALPPAARCQNGTGILMEPGLVLRAAPPRQLTLNARVSQFYYQPGGDGIAYACAPEDGGETEAIKFIGTHQKHPDTRTLYDLSTEQDDGSADKGAYGLTLEGWSGDGRFLLFSRWAINSIGLPYFRYLFCDMSVSPAVARFVPLPEDPSGQDYSDAQLAWSPDRQRLLLSQYPYDTDQPANGTPLAAACTIYDPARDKSVVVTIRGGEKVRGWLDDRHVLLYSVSSEKPPVKTYYSYDVSTASEAPITASAARAAMSTSSYGAQLAPTTPKLPGLTLETHQHTLKDAQGVAQTKAQTVWIRSAKAPRMLSALAVGVTPGADDPQAQWSPDGDGVAFIAHRDLFVAALTTQEATPYEKVAAGETLGCAEEKQILMSNLKQIGLGILQYSQDNDERFPSGDGWHGAVYPYIKDESVFDFAGIRPVYHAPASLSLAAMASPADTVLATADTPCAHIVLYADGHVKAFDKATAATP